MDDRSFFGRDLSPGAVSRALDQFSYQMEDAKREIARIKKRKADYISMFDDEIARQETRIQEAILVLDMLKTDYNVDLTEIIIDVPEIIEKQSLRLPEKNVKQTKQSANCAPEHKKYEIVPLTHHELDLEDMSDEEFLRIYGSPIF
jgi:hypothetical protein